MKVAIVEDDINLRKALELSLVNCGLEIKFFKNPRDALKELDDSFDVVVTDINMPHMNGIDFIKELNGKYETVVITGNASLENAIEAMRMGTKDFLTKPFDANVLIDAIKRGQKIKDFNKKTNIQNPKKQSDDFIASSAKLEGIKQMALKAAKTDASIMLLGASGVGKEMFANFIHKNSTRANGPFIAINMAAIPEHLLESELFGYEKGAFTDATYAKIGLFEEANGGSIFLDEIGDMPYKLQVKILRALQEQEIVRLGGSKPIKIDFRVISATNADINSKIKDSLFREDLYFRLNTLPILIPPLKDRQEEIIPLSEWKLNAVCQKYNFEPKSISDEAKQTLLSYQWPGNIRELLSIIERAAILSDTNQISSQDLYLEARSEALVGKKLF